MDISKKQFSNLVELNRNKLHLVEERIGTQNKWRILSRMDLSLFNLSNFIKADTRKMDNREVLYIEFDNGYYLERYRIDKSSISGI